MWSAALEWIEKYGLESIVIIAIIGAGYVFYEQGIKYYFQRKLKKDANKDVESNKQEQKFLTSKHKDDLKNQEFFSNIEFKLNVDVPSEDFSSDPVSDELLRGFMKSLLSAYHKNMMDFVKEMNVEWNNTEWRMKLNSVNYKAMDDFKASCIEKSFPNEAIKKFLVWYTPYMQQIFFYIRKISMMQNKNAVENTNTFLLLLELILMNAFSDIVKYPSIKNDLDGIEYKGNIVGENAE